MTMNYNNPALEAELAYRRERLAAEALGNGRRTRWLSRGRRNSRRAHG